MNEDDIVLQPDIAKSEDVNSEDAAQEDKPNSEALPADAAPDDANSPRVFDFSSDFNISAVADETAESDSNSKVDQKNTPSSPKPAPVLAPKPVPVAESKPVSMPRPPQTHLAPPVPPAPIIAPIASVPPAPPSSPEAKPAVPYREPIDTTQKWPFAFGAPSSAQPLMNPSASAPALAPDSAPAGSPGKRSPMSQPVKTIRSEGGEQAAEKDISRPAGGLQRDVSAILPNLKKDNGAPQARSSVLSSSIASSQNSDIKPLRTYESDVAEVLSHRNISTASMAIAENKRKTGEERLGAKGSERETAKEIPRIAIKAPEVSAPAPVMPPVIKTQAQTREEAFAPRPASRPVDQGFRGAVISAPPPAPSAPSHMVRNILLILLSVALIGGGLVGGYYLYSRSALSSIPLKPNPAVTTPTASVKSLIPAEAQVIVPTDSQSMQSIAARIQDEIAKPQNPNTVREILLTQSAAGVQKQITPANIAGIMKIPVPDVILRTLQPKWMLGVYADVSGAKNVFVAATTDTFQNAFAGMLGWEALMPNSLNAYINAGTSTPLQGRFIDEIVKNKDVRAFVTPQSEQTIFLYSFLNNSMLVVSNNEVALAEIVTRLENQAFIR